MVDTQFVEVSVQWIAARSGRVEFGGFRVLADETVAYVSPSSPCRAARDRRLRLAVDIDGHRAVVIDAGNVMPLAIVDAPFAAVIDLSRIVVHVPVDLAGIGGIRRIDREAIVFITVKRNDILSACGLCANPGTDGQSGRIG